MKKIKLNYSVVVRNVVAILLFIACLIANVQIKNINKDVGGDNYEFNCKPSSKYDW